MLLVLLVVIITHCYSLEQSTRSYSIDGLEYQLDSPDLWVDRNACLNISSTTGWLSDYVSGEWVESGLTKGDVRNVGCVTLLKTYYAYNSVSDFGNNYVEYLVPNGIYFLII